VELKEIKEYVAKLGLPAQDNYELSTSNKTFPDGAHFRTEELPTTVEQYEKMFAISDKLNLTVNRITDVRGIMFDSDSELLHKFELAREHGSEVIMGPGAAEQPYDISQQAEIHALVEGKVRGMDQVVYTIQSMLRAAELGCRGFLMYDEGVLLIALKMRREGYLPTETKFKISANVSVANAAAIKFWFDLLDVQDEINPIRDLTLPMISAMRQVVDNPLDLHIFHRVTVARIMDAAEIVRVGSPVYLKNARFGPGLTVEDRALQCFRVVEAINKQFPEARQSKPGAKGLAIPVKPSTK
jgi:hypothetical protein